MNIKAIVNAVSKCSGLTAYYYADVKDDTIVFSIVVQENETSLQGEIEKPLFIKSLDLVSGKTVIRTYCDNEPLFNALDAHYVDDFVKRDSLVMFREYLQGESGSLVYDARFGQMTYVADVTELDIDDGSRELCMLVNYDYLLVDHVKVKVSDY